MENIQKIETAYGEVLVSKAIFYEDGSLKSGEPQEPVFISHDTGLYIAFDNTPLKDEAHEPTLEFGPLGQIQALRTVGTGLICRDSEGRVHRIGAQWRPDPRGTGANVLVPIRIEFLDEALRVTDSDGEIIELSVKDYEIQVDYLTDNIVMAGGCGDCSSCNGCSI